MSSTVVIGCTGLVGNEIIKTLTNLPTFPSIHTISRRAPKQSSSKLTAHVETDSSKWVDALKSLSPTPATVISALGTTRAQAGSITAQWKIDHDLNVEIAKAAKAQGVKTFVFVSSAGTRSMLGAAAPYSKMKIGVEDTVMALGFENVVILRPAMIMGQREEMGLGNKIFNGLVNGLGKVSQGLKDVLGQDADVIGRAAVSALAMVNEGKAPNNPWILESADIVKYGRDEWKE